MTKKKKNLRRRNVRPIYTVKGPRRKYAYGGSYNIDEMEYQGASGNEQTLGAISGVMQGAEMGQAFGPVGTAIGAVGGGLIGAAMGESQAKKKQWAGQASLSTERDRREEIAKQILANYPTKGVEGAKSYYKMGGKLRPGMYTYGGKVRYMLGGKMKKWQVGGQMMQQPGVDPSQFETLASDVQMVDGPKHTQGGVNAGGGNEVEGGEVTVPMKDEATAVYSDQLMVSEGMTFAQKAKELGKKKGDWEEDMNSTSIFVKGTARRNIEKIDNQLQLLFMQQEQMKQAMGIPNPGDEQQMPSPEAQEAQMMGAQNQMESAVETSARPMAAAQMPAGAGGMFMKGGKMRYKMGGKMRFNNGGTIKPKTNPNQILGGDLFFSGTYFDDDKMKNLNIQHPDQVETLTANDNQPSYEMDTTPYGEGLGTTNNTVQPKKKGKFNFNELGAKILPFADNVVNTAITAFRPSVPKPRNFRALPMKTEVNINPQLAAMDATEANLFRQLKDGTAGDWRTRRANMVAGTAGLVGARNQLYGQKENLETQRQNQAMQNLQQVTNLNIGKEEAYDKAQYLDQRSRQNEISANVAEGAEDAQMLIRQENLKKRDALELDLLKQQYKDSGVWDRNLEKLFDDYQKGLKTWSEFSSEVNKYGTKG